MGIKAEQAIAERVAQEGFEHLVRVQTFTAVQHIPGMLEMLRQLYMAAFYAGANHGLAMSERLISDELRQRGEGEEPSAWN